MPRTINGVGTRFYGQCDWRADGSFQTTLWLVMMYVPIVPFKTLRVLHTGGNAYRVFDELPVSPSQALRTYGFAAGYLVGMPWLLIAVTSRMTFTEDAPLRSLLQMAVLGLVTAAPFLALKALRSSARRQAGVIPARARSR